MQARILVTGAAGFIGFHVCHALLKDNNCEILGLDNINDYYDIKIKQKRLKELEILNNKMNKYKFKRINLTNKKLLKEIFSTYKPSIVIHLAAQAGVRYSLQNPNAYIESNLLGFCNVIENCKIFNIKNFIYASSSSVYGGNSKIPFEEEDPVDHPISFYASTKKSNELIAHSYSHLFNLSCTGLRLFTVYGPYGRPDMAPMIFTKAIMNDQPIKLFNNGDISRDFTYINDVVQIIKRLINKPATFDIDKSKSITNPIKSEAPHRIFNIAYGESIQIIDFVKIIEKELGKKASIEYLKMQPGDVKNTEANIEKIKNWVNYKPTTNIDAGMKIFVDWYKKFMNWKY